MDVIASVAVAAEGKPNALHVTTACEPIMYVDASVTGVPVVNPMLGFMMEKLPLGVIMEPTVSLTRYLPEATVESSMLTNDIGGPTTDTPALMRILATVSALTRSIITLPERPADHQLTIKGCPTVDIWPATGERTLSSPAAAMTANDSVSTQSFPSAVVTRTKYDTPLLPVGVAVNGKTNVYIQVVAASTAEDRVNGAKSTLLDTSVTLREPTRNSDDHMTEMEAPTLTAGGAPVLAPIGMFDVRLKRRIVGFAVTVTAAENATTFSSAAVKRTRTRYVVDIKPVGRRH